MLNTRLQSVIDQHGPWTAMAIKLTDDIYTREPAVDYRLRRILQVAADYAKKPLCWRRTKCSIASCGSPGIERCSKPKIQPKPKRGLRTWRSLAGRCKITRPRPKRVVKKSRLKAFLSE